jgi:predicted RNase H-like nuclease (RuvC/YqgF family)
MDRCWYCGEPKNIDDKCHCDRQSEKIIKLESRVRELEAERTLFQEYVAKDPKVMEDSEREMDLTERIYELEDERDRLNVEVERQKRLDLSGECDRLRARHAALVEAVEFALPWLNEVVPLCGGAKGHEVEDKLKAALAEVK